MLSLMGLECLIEVLDRLRTLLTHNSKLMYIGSYCSIDTDEIGHQQKRNQSSKAKKKSICA